VPSTYGKKLGSVKKVDNGFGNLKIHLDTLQEGSKDENYATMLMLSN